MEKRKDIVTMKGNPMTLLGPEIKPGMRAPDFTLVDRDLNEVTLDDGKGKVRIFSVVPSIDTGVCDAQTRRFNEEAAKLKEVEIWTISVDLPFAQKRYCDAQGIDQVKLLSDHKYLSFGENYGFAMEEVRLLARGIVVVDRDNKVRYVEHVKEVSTHPDYERALEEVRKL
ncbi:thiol peroxidase [Irregularibacter muris]|uniref:Thiol peroxidase n=1 Tax=Irregularibacter muris TaxID=1796619 RepID=A0AAE3HGM8_9FIRM|nr:thiol peroxidase [Irregularibacter muris]MCR1899000.1 thiol peroxidase [Irregularibacter muris]